MDSILLVSHWNRVNEKENNCVHEGGSRSRRGSEDEHGTLSAIENVLSF